MSSLFLRFDKGSYIPIVQYVLGHNQEIDVSTDTVTTCMNTTAILVCHVANTGMSDLLVDSLSIEPLDEQSKGVFSFVNPSDDVGFILSSGSVKTIEILFYPVWTKKPIPDSMTFRANLIAYNCSLFNPVAVSDMPMIGHAIHKFYQQGSSYRKNRLISRTEW